MTQRVVNYKYGTGNPVLPDGSVDVRDGIDNLQSFDVFMNADDDTYNQRDGEIVKTLAGAVRSVGISRVGDFTAGCTVTARNQGVLYETDGTVYVWIGALPKVVQPSSSPSTTGGISPSGDWVDVGDASAYARITNELSSPNGVNMVGGAAKQSDLSSLSDKVDGVAFDVSLESPFSQKVRLGQSDCYVLMQGDSTGDADNEWFRLTANSIAAKYPTHTVKYVTWAHASTSWSTPVVISTGSGPRTIWFYNGSHAGSVAGYWYGSRSTLAFDGKKFDTIFTNYGLNVPTGLSYQQEQHAEHLVTLRSAQPYADIISCIQPVDYAIPDRNPLRSLAQKRVCSFYGVRVVDVMRKFLDLVASTGGDYTPWYIDSLHPSPAGSAEWSKLAVQSLVTSKGDRLSTPSGAEKNSDIPNGMFRSFLSGASSCADFWSPINTTAIKDQVNFETFNQSLRGIGAGDGSSAVVCLQSTDELMEKYKHMPQIVIAARLRTSISSGAGSDKCGRLFFAHSVGTSYTEVSNTQASYADVNNAFRWSFLIVDSSFWVGKSDFRIGVYCGKASEIVSIDRIIISPSILVPDCSGQDYCYSIEKNDGSHSVPANSTTSRGFTITSPIVVNPGMLIDVSIYPTIAGVNASAVCSQSGSIQVLYTNTTGSSVSIPVNTVKLQIRV